MRPLTAAFFVKRVARTPLKYWMRLAAKEVPEEAPWGAAMYSVPLFAVLSAVVILIGAAAAIYALARIAARGRIVDVACAPAIARAEEESDLGAEVIPAQQLLFEPRALPTTQAEIYRLAFGVSQLEYPVAPAHQAVLRRARGLRDAAITQRQYFPRKPLLMPQLMRLMNDSNSSRRALTDLIMQDPVLAGDVLKTANSSYYRVGRPSVESIDRSLSMLGTNGLRHVVAGCILRPVFQSSDACFPDFSALMWDLAYRTGGAAAAFAVTTATCERAAAQLVGLLTALGPLMLFRLVRDSYTKHESELPPRAEVFIALLQESGAVSSERIAASWDLSAAFQLALQEQIDPLPDMSALGCALCLGRFAAESALLIEHANAKADAVRGALQSQGLQETVVDALMAGASMSASAGDVEPSA